MAGNVRQPIDVASLERYIASNVPEIAVPVDVKQVSLIEWHCGDFDELMGCSSDMASPTQRTS
jgi:hypothetical protein